MFSFKKKKKGFPIRKGLLKAQNTGYLNIGVTVYKNEQVLFQIMRAIHFEKQGLECNNEKDLCLLIDFNKNRTETWSCYDDSINHKLSDFEYFEEPKGIHGFVKNVGQNPNEIDDYTNQKIFEIFELKPNDKWRIEFSAG